MSRSYVPNVEIVEFFLFCLRNSKLFVYFYPNSLVFADIFCCEFLFVDILLNAQIFVDEFIVFCLFLSDFKGCRLFLPVFRLFSSYSRFSPILTRIDGSSIFYFDLLFFYLIPNISTIFALNLMIFSQHHLGFSQIKSKSSSVDLFPLSDRIKSSPFNRIATYRCDNDWISEYQITD